MVRIFIALITLLFVNSVFAITELNATLDKNPVVVNESFILTVTANGDVDRNALDTSALLKDFIVGRTSTSSQTSMINFNTTRTTTWTTVLIARKAGSFTIPPFTVEGLKSKAISLSVVNADDIQSKSQQDLFITTSVSSKDVYVQQQLTMTVKLHFATELKRGSLTDPTLEGASIAQIGEDKESDNIINGRRYRVIERTYAISPQKSGELILKSPVFSGEVIAQSTRRSNFFSFSETKPVSVIGDEIAISVRPIPDSFQGVWLPSELLAIHQEWQPDIREFTVGEPITRTITLTAANLSEEQLPKITMEMPAGLKVYPDQAQLHTGINQGRLVSQQVQNFALVASKAGEFELPEINIPWWNTVTNKHQLATIPAQKIIVKADSTAVATSNVTAQTQTNDISPSKTIIVTQNSWLQWLFLALWLLTLCAWFFTYKNSQTKTGKSSKKQTDRPNQSYLLLLAACKKNQGLAVLSLLLPWLNHLMGSETTTSTIANLDDALTFINNNELNKQITHLQACYYGKEPTNWQGDQLFPLIQHINKSGIKKNTPDVLALNP